MDENNQVQNTYGSDQQEPAQQYQQQAYQQPQYQQQDYQQAQYQQTQYQQQYQQPQYQQPQYQQAQYQQPYGGQQYYSTQPAPFPNNSTTYIVLSVLEFLFCGGLLAIIPFIFSLQYRDAYLQGNYDLAAQKKKTAKTALIVILAIGIVLTILGIIAIVTAGAYTISVSN